MARHGREVEVRWLDGPAFLGEELKAKKRAHKSMQNQFDC